MRFLILAIMLLLFSIFLAAYYQNRFEKGRYKHKKPYILAFFGVGLFLAGNIMMFFVAGWKWGLASLGISWLAVLSTMSVSAFMKGIHTPVQFNPSFQERVKEVISVKEQHNAELEDFLDLTSPDECASLMINFLEQLRLKYPREYSQLNPERLPDSISEMVRNSIGRAYTAGYMMGKGWISKENLLDFNLFLGDELAYDLRLTFKGAKSKGTAFALGYTAVAARGRLKVLQETLGNR